MKWFRPSNFQDYCSIALTFPKLQQLILNWKPGANKWATLKDHLWSSQIMTRLNDWSSQIMTPHNWNIEFDVDGMVHLKLQPYWLISLLSKNNKKLSNSFTINFFSDNNSHSFILFLKNSFKLFPVFFVHNFQKLSPNMPLLPFASSLLKAKSICYFCVSCLKKFLGPSDTLLTVSVVYKGVIHPTPNKFGYNGKVSHRSMLLGNHFNDSSTPSLFYT